MENLVRDVRFGVRMLLGTPGTTLAALAALALGIGANTAIFSAVYAILLRPFPVADPERLVSIVSVNPRFQIAGTETGYPTYAEWKRENRSFESLAAARKGMADLATGTEDGQVRFWRVGASFFPMLGVQPTLGRGFLEEEDQPGAGRVAMLSDETWRRRFAGEREVLGNTITLEGEPYTVVGVLPPHFQIDGVPAEIYAPIALSTAPTRRPAMVSIYGKLRLGTTIAQAQAEMDVICGRLDREKRGWGARVWDLREAQVHDFRLSLLVLLGAVGLVLLIACANVASLLLARAGARRREIAVRIALGASRPRLMRQLLTESTLLALAGGALGLLLAEWLARLAPQLQHERLPGLLTQSRIDGAVLAFTMMVSVLTGLLFGAAPALGVSQVNVQETLKEGGRTGEGLPRRRLWNVLMVSETALAVVLMIGATLLVRSFLYLRDEAPGFRVDGLLTARIEPPLGKYTRPEQTISLYRDVLERVRAIPGVESASLATALPLSGDLWAMSMPIEGQHFTHPSQMPILWHRTVDTEYFRTMQIPLRRGRFFTLQDGMGALRVAIINETMARRFWPEQEAIGKHLGTPGSQEYTEIVGVVGDVRHMDVTKDPPVEVFFHYLQGPPSRATLAVRADGAVYRDPLLMASAVRDAVAAVDRGQPVTRVATLDQIATERILPKRLTAWLLAAFAGLALLLAAVGTYGVLSFSVAQRRHEIGVRMALGATRSTVLGMVVRQATGLTLLGVSIGLALALGLTRWIASLLYGVSAKDPWVYAGAAATLVAVAAVAAYLPARRAASVDPVLALRRE